MSYHLATNQGDNTVRKRPPSTCCALKVIRKYIEVDMEISYLDVEF